jgi:RNA polymerase subunit RPABC4/transcription elongation factor Spt4
LDSNVLNIALIYGGVVLVAFWAAMVIWAYRDMRARSRDPLAQIFAAVAVALLTIPGLFIYILLRPRETLSEAYERSLEEEALLQEIEEKPTCPGCGQRVNEDWQACPYCHTRLKKLCLNCDSLLDLSWNLCPYCAADQTRYQPDSQVVSASRHVDRVVAEPPPSIPDKWLASPNNPSADYPQYIDDET